MSEEKPSLGIRIISALVFFVLISGIFYALSFGFFYFTADDVECGNIAGIVPYCSGTYESSLVQKNISQKCYMNGEKVNCSQIKDSNEDFPEVYN